MKKSKRVLCLVLAFILSLCIGTTTGSAKSQASAYLAAYLAYVYPEGNGKVSVWYEVQAVQTMDEVGVITIRLRELAPGSSSWEPVKTWFSSNYPNMLGSNVWHYEGHVDYQGKPGYMYAAYVTVWAGDNGDGDSRIITTAAVTAK